MDIIQLEFDFGKMCSRCRSFVDRTLFKASKQHSEGLHNWCKPCCRVYEADRKSKVNAVRRQNYAERGRGVNPRAHEIKEARRLARLENTRHWNHNVAAKRRGVPGTYTKREWDDLCAMAGWRCVCCRQERPLTVDHVVPLLVGGTNFINNIQPLCKPCNSKKGIQSTDYRWWLKG